MTASAETGPEPVALRLLLEPVLRAIAVDRTGVGLRELRPRDADYPKVFRPAALGAARCRYETLWAGPLDFRHPPGDATVEIHLFRAERLTADLAVLLVPERVWAAWTYRGAAGGISYDGLAWCDDHWAWFPKPARLING